ARGQEPVERCHEDPPGTVSLKRRSTKSAIFNRPGMSFASEKASASCCSPEMTLSWGGQAW
ncbi:MAG: hypothetical protein J2P17_34665, partial [Mycobacterium sp.]|nr:hypothetical protein [Mycobacterium sp.]